MLQGNTSHKWQRAMMVVMRGLHFGFICYKWQLGPPLTLLVLGYKSLSQLLTKDAQSSLEWHILQSFVTSCSIESWSFHPSPIWSWGYFGLKKFWTIIGFLGMGWNKGQNQEVLTNTPFMIDDMWISKTFPIYSCPIFNYNWLCINTFLSTYQIAAKCFYLHT
jgi:hypothetical protein